MSKSTTSSNHNHNKAENALKRKKRILPTAKKNVAVINSLPPPSASLITEKSLTLIRRKKRQLQPIVKDRSPSPTTSLIRAPSPTTPTLPSSTPKRSLRAASDAITKREEEKKKQQDVKATPVVKKKRKLNLQRVVMMPTSTSSPDDELVFQDAAVDTYSKYLNPKEVQTSGNIAPVILGVKNRKIIQKKAILTRTTTIIPTPPSSGEQPLTQEEESLLDLSQHSILPDSSYIAHLPPRRASISNSHYSENSISSTYSSASPKSEFFDATSNFMMENTNEVNGISCVDRVPTDNDSSDDMDTDDQVEPQDVSFSEELPELNTQPEQPKEKSPPPPPKTFWNSLFNRFNKK